MKTVKYQIILGLICALLTTGCKSISRNKPSKTDIQKAVFEDSFPFYHFEEFNIEFSDNPELAKENKYELYIETICWFKEDCFRRYELNNPLYYKNKGLDLLAILASQNNLLKNEGKKGLSPILWKTMEKGTPLNYTILASIKKTEKRWICTDAVQLEGTDLKEKPASFFPKECLIWGSQEHLAELKEYGLTLPDKTKIEEEKEKRFNDRIKTTRFIPETFEIK